MFTFRNMLAVAVFLFGTTFLWMMPLFIGPHATGILWNFAQVLGFLAILGFTVTAWGIVTAAGWWEPVAIASSVVGVAATIPYAISAPSLPTGGDPLSLGINIGMHALGSAAVVAALLVSSSEHWIAGRI
ncbi:MAG TPA: hypothetical protein VGP82_25735 [Ktedonobacterales bacterium]|jgi:hypothetical protein|nr:hypothetical protein [Ktedonobacterales bacterium]